ncbi:MAG: SRPBCC family protein [Desulfobacter sp.]|nr:SRPBCC family protein [Desulfobacter sp.]WDP85610.1 MAG: SRPBCC family protein [Desulfobacter sp.]
MQKNILIDKFLPCYTFNEYHEILVDSPIEKVYKAASDVDLSESKTITWLFKIRGLPTKRLNLQGFIHDIGFTHLGCHPPYENLMGFWARAKIVPVPGYEAFAANSISPWIKVVWNFQFEKLEPNKTKFSTETRVLCVASITKLTFGFYWFIIKPFSGLIRQKMLKIIKKDAEAEGMNGET